MGIAITIDCFGFLTHQSHMNLKNLMTSEVAIQLALSKVILRIISVGN